MLVIDMTADLSNPPKSVQLGSRLYERVLNPDESVRKGDLVLMSDDAFGFVAGELRIVVGPRGDFEFEPINDQIIYRVEES